MPDIFCHEEPQIQIKYLKRNQVFSTFLCLRNSTYIYVYIYIYVIYHLPQKQWTPWLKALWLMSAALVGPALEVIREARWWFTSPSGSCPVAFFVLAAIVLCICSFTTGVLCGCCLSSRRCRVWLWHCISGLQELWVDSRGPAVTEVRRRLRDYRA